MLSRTTLSNANEVRAWGISRPLSLSYGLVALKGRCPALADGVAAVPSFTVMSPCIGLDYFGIFDGFFGAYFANHFVERLHVAVAKEIEGELHAEAPRYLQAGADLQGWWRTVLRQAFRVVDDELVARVAGNGVAVGSPAVVALVLEKYLVLANRGGATRAVIYRGQEAVQLTSKRSNEPCKKEEEEEHMEEGNAVRSTSILQDNMATSRAISFRPYFPEPEVLMLNREPGDKFMILATSGFWAHISPDEACNFILKKLRMSPTDMLLANTLDETGFQTIIAKELAKQAIIRGSRSNVTVGVILFK